MANFVGTIVTRTTAGPLATGADPGDSIFIAIQAERGLEDTVHEFTSYARFRQMFGGAEGTPLGSDTRITEADEVLNILYSKGTSRKRCFAVRCVGSSALQAFATVPDGSAVSTIKIHAKGSGTWANTYEATVSSGTKADTWKLELFKAASDTVALETFDNLTLTDASLEAVSSQSDYISLENLNSATAAPGNLPEAGDYLLGATQAGVDDNAPSASDIVGTDEGDGVKTGLKAFRDKKYGRGFIIAPGLDSDAAVRSEMEGHFDAFSRVSLFAAPAGKTVSTVQDDVPDLLGAYYWALPKVQDSVTEEIKPISPVGHVLAEWFEFLANEDYGKHPAGKDFKVDRVIGIESQSNGAAYIDEAVAETLVGKGINPVYDKGSGLKIWGARTCSTDPNWAYLHALYAFCVISDRLQRLLDDQIYETASAGSFFEDLEEGMRILMADLNSKGMFDGSTPSSREAEDFAAHGFSVKANRELLTPSDLATNTIRVKVWFKDSLTAETIRAEIAKRAPTA